MGEIADAMLSGAMCAMCGVPINCEDYGVPMYCSLECATDAGIDPDIAPDLVCKETLE